MSFNEGKVPFESTDAEEESKEPRQQEHNQSLSEEDRCKELLTFWKFNKPEVFERVMQHGQKLLNVKVYVYFPSCPKVDEDGKDITEMLKKKLGP